MTDEEALDMLSNKEILASIFLGILRYIPIKERYDHEKYKIELQTKLKFKHIDDPELLRSCIDLLEDTEYAIIEYKGFGLEINNRIGEKYLRLYGLLNSVYQQIYAIIELVELFNYHSKKEIVQRLKSLKIFDLRNKLAAHTINFHLDKKQKPSKENLDFFRLAQTTLSRWGENILVVSHRNHTERINLKTLIAEYINYSDNLLLNVCNKALNSLFKNEGEHRQWLMFRYDFLVKRMK